MSYIERLMWRNETIRGRSAPPSVDKDVLSKQLHEDYDTLLHALENPQATMATIVIGDPDFVEKFKRNKFDDEAEIIEKMDK